MKGWLPHKRMRPMCQEVETVAHSLYGCKFLCLSIDTIFGVTVMSPNPHLKSLSYVVDPTFSDIDDPRGCIVVIVKACELGSAFPTTTHTRYLVHTSL